MNSRTLGSVVGAVSAAVAAWWYSRQARFDADSSNRGTVIFDNTPAATPLSDRGSL